MSSLLENTESRNSTIGELPPSAGWGDSTPGPRRRGSRQVNYDSGKDDAVRRALGSIGGSLADMSVHSTARKGSLAEGSLAEGSRRRSLLVRQGSVTGGRRRQSVARAGETQRRLNHIFEEQAALMPQQVAVEYAGLRLEPHRPIA